MNIPLLIVLLVAPIFLGKISVALIFRALDEVKKATGN